MNNERSYLSQINKRLIQRQQTQFCKIPEDMSQNPRWLYIHIKNLSQLTQMKQVNEQIEHKIKFEMGDKKSFSVFTTKPAQNHKITQQILKNIQRQTYLFCYEGQQLLTIKLIRRKKKALQSKFEVVTQIGFGKIIVTPFVVFPYTRHKVKVKMVTMQQSKSVSDTPFMIADLQIFYFLNFQAQIQISPLYGSFERNIASIGTMRLCCIITINGQRKKSTICQDGGIYPNWSKQCQMKNKSPQYIQRYSKEQLDNNFRFDLSSVGHTMTIQIVHYPFFDKDAQLVGKAQISLQSYQFFTTPQIEVIHQKQNGIKLFYTDPIKETKQYAGQIQLKSLFYFNAKATRQQVDSEQDT